jgi:hypothetical protein
MRDAQKARRESSLGFVWATKRAWHISSRNLFAPYERLHILVVTTEWRAVEFIELFETSIHVFLEGISMLGRNNLISVKFSHIGEEAISPKFGVTPLHEGERS